MNPIQLNLGLLAQNPLYRDERTRRAITFFVTKGFAAAPSWPHQPSRKQLTLAEVLWVCDHVVPEMHRVMPAAVLRYPHQLAGGVPGDLAEATRHLAAGDEDGPGFRGHAYWSLREWARAVPRDRRHRAALSRRVSYRLPVDLLRWLDETAKRKGRTQTQVVIDALAAVATPHREILG